MVSGAQRALLQFFDTPEVVCEKNDCIFMKQINLYV
jgi:hypothetical protein